MCRSPAPLPSMTEQKQANEMIKFILMVSVPCFSSFNCLPAAFACKDQEWKGRSVGTSSILMSRHLTLFQVNKQGQTRLAQYYADELMTIQVCTMLPNVRFRPMLEFVFLCFIHQAKSALEGEIIRKCLARNETQCSFLEYQNYKCIYRR